MDQKPVSLADIHKFFKGDGDYKLAQFRKEWADLTDGDKAQIKAGLEDGSLTY